jgi:type I restriction enzyme, S subunit
MSKNSNSFINILLEDLISSEPKSIISGPFGSNIGKRFFQKKGIPVIRGNNLSTNTIKFIDSGFVFITKEKADELNCYAVKNDIIFTAVGTIGQVGIIEEDLKYNEYIISNKQIRVRFNSSRILPLYAYYWFSSKWMQNLILKRNVGSTVPLLNLSVIKGLPILLPISTLTQKRIVEILENLSSKIELNNRINRELEQMAKLLYDYWFVQFEFPDTNGNPYKSNSGKMVYNMELKREIPEGWEVESLADNCDIVDCLHSKKPDTIFESVEYYLLQLENLRDDGLLDISNKYFVTKSDYEEWTQRIEVKDGDILITNAGRVAATVQVPGNVITGIGRNITAIRPITVNPTYLFLAFRGIDIKHQILKNTDTGSFFQSLNVRGIKNLKVVRANYEIENSFEKIVLPFRRNREHLLSENHHLITLRDWLLPMLMNGQVWVGEAGKKEYQPNEAGLDLAAEPGN